eukprot:3706187-Pyramimonas_sp.AAC.1
MSSRPTAVTTFMSTPVCCVKEEMSAWVCDATMASRGVPRSTCEVMNATRWRTLATMVSAVDAAITG